MQTRLLLENADLREQLRDESTSDRTGADDSWGAWPWKPDFSRSSRSGRTPTAASPRRATAAAKAADGAASPLRNGAAPLAESPRHGSRAKGGGDAGAAPLAVSPQRNGVGRGAALHGVPDPAASSPLAAGRRIDSAVPAVGTLSTSA